MVLTIIFFPRVTYTKYDKTKLIMDESMNVSPMRTNESSKMGRFYSGFHVLGKVHR